MGSVHPISEPLNSEIENLEKEIQNDPKDKEPLNSDIENLEKEIQNDPNYKEPLNSDIENVEKEIENDPNYQEQLNERNEMRNNAKQERKEKIKDLEKQIKDLETEKKKKEYYYNCLWIHYYNRSGKNGFRKLLDRIDNPFRIVKSNPPTSPVSGLIEDKKEKANVPSSKNRDKEHYSD